MQEIPVPSPREPAPVKEEALEPESPARDERPTLQDAVTQYQWVSLFHLN